MKNMEMGGMEMGNVQGSMQGMEDCPMMGESKTGEDTMEEGEKSSSDSQENSDATDLP